MKRNLIYAALSLCLLMAGCGGEQDTPAPTPASPSNLVAVEPAPAEEDISAPVEESPAEIETPAEPEPPYEMASGVWLAATDVGYSNYYYFDAQAQTGSYVSLEYGLGMPFSYSGDGDELVFHLEGHDAEMPATVDHVDEERFDLLWEDSLPETLHFVSEGTLEDFHFYSNNELAMLALEHYTEANGDAPSQIGSMTNADNTVTIQLYENLGDHNSTAAWYVVDRFTATGVDLTSGEQVELLPAEEEVPQEPEFPVEEESAEELPPDMETPEVETIPTPDVPGEIYAES